MAEKVSETIDRIINLTDGLSEFWKTSNGWARDKSYELLSKSRLEWQTQLSKKLHLIIDKSTEKDEGLLIIGWSILGSLVEGTIKLFLSVWYDEYESDALLDNNYLDKKGKLKEPDELMLENLKQFLSKKVYPNEIRAIWKSNGEFDLIDFIDRIQYKRNAIHAFKNRDIGNFELFYEEIENYLIFLRKMTDTFPYPDDEMYKPREY